MNFSMQKIDTTLLNLYFYTLIILKRSTLDSRLDSAFCDIDFFQCSRKVYFLSPLASFKTEFVCTF